MRSEKFDLWDYFDVWGNEDDGWEVNNQCKVAENIVISEQANNDDVIDFLKSIDFIVETCCTDDFYILWDDGYIEIFGKETGKPLCCFRSQWI